MFTVKSKKKKKKSGSCESSGKVWAVVKVANLEIVTKDFLSIISKIIGSATPITYGVPARASILAQYWTFDTVVFQANIWYIL